MRLFEIIRQNIEQKRLAHEAEIEREHARIEKLLDSPIPWDNVIELSREEENINGRLCYLKKYAICPVSRNDVLKHDEVEGVVITGDDFGKQIVLTEGQDFYGKDRLKLWDMHDYVWYSYGKNLTLTNQSFSTVADLNDYVNQYNKNLLEGKSSNINTNIEQINHRF